MNKQQLENNLTNVIDKFCDSIRSNYSEYSKEPATYEDLNELARQTSYALQEFRDNILKYLD